MITFKFAYPAVNPQGIYQVAPDESGLDLHVRTLYFEGTLMPGAPFIEEVFEENPGAYALVRQYADFYVRQKTLHTFLTEVATAHLRRLNAARAA